jgi:hypothetical protein
MSTSSADSPSSSAALPPLLSLAELMAAAPPPVRWLWDGYLAPGKLTLLTSQWKMGKTTLLSVLLAKMKAGGELPGQRVAPTRAAATLTAAGGCWRCRASARRRGTPSSS